MCNHRIPGSKEKVSLQQVAAQSTVTSLYHCWDYKVVAHMVMQ